MSKKLKHTVQTERTMYDLADGARNAVELLQIRRRIHMPEGSSSEGCQVCWATGPADDEGKRVALQWFYRCI